MVILEDGTWKNINVTANMISGYNKDILGDQTVTVTFLNRSVTFNVTVGMPVSFVFLKSPPRKTIYYSGEDLDLTDAKITVAYNDGTWVDVIVTPSMISGYDENKLGNQTVNVSYLNITLTFNVSVIENPVINIFLKSAPTKTNYIIGQELDLTGAKLTVIYENGKWKDIDILPDMISGYNADSLGQQTVTVSYSDLTVTFDVNVAENKMSAIFLKKKPNKTVYITGEEIDISGAFITIIYENGTWADMPITKDMISGYNKNIISQQSINVSLYDKSTSFTVTTTGTNKISAAANSKVSINRPEKLLTNVAPFMKISELSELLYPNGGTLRFLNKYNEVMNSGIVGTDSKVQLLDSGGKVIDELFIILYGDTNGDGYINTLDMITVKNQILNKQQLYGIYYRAGDVLNDGKISITSLLTLKSFLLGGEYLPGNDSTYKIPA